MRELLPSLIQIARRTAQPYAYTLRAATAYIVLAALILFCIFVIRVTWLAPALSCGTPVQVTTVGQAQPVSSCSAFASAVAAFPDYARGVLDHLSAVLIIGIIAALLVLFLTTKNQSDRDLAAVEPWNIHPALMDALGQTKNYWFRGRSGRFLRDTVLPALDDNARKESSQRTIHLLLPDPLADETLNRYAHYRNSLASNANDQWTAERIRTEILATILRAAELQANNQFLEVHISLSSSFALYRSDMSDSKLIMTREEPKWPALMCAAGSVFYDSFQEEMRIAHSLGKQLDLSVLGYGARVDVASLPATIQRLRLDGLNITAELCADILNAMRTRSSPYA